MQTDISFQFVQRQAEAVEEMLHKIVETGKVQLGQRGIGLLGGGLKLRVARFQLLHAFEIGGELVGGFHDGRDRRVGLHEKRLIARAKLRGQQRQQLFAAHALDLLVGGFDGGVIVFDGGRQVAGQNF